METPNSMRFLLSYNSKTSTHAMGVLSSYNFRRQIYTFFRQVLTSSRIYLQITLQFLDFLHKNDVFLRENAYLCTRSSEQIDIIGSDIPNHHLRKDEPTPERASALLCAGVSTTGVACGEPGMRRNGLRISVG